MAWAGKAAGLAAGIGLTALTGGAGAPLIPALYKSGAKLDEKNPLNFKDKLHPRRTSREMLRADLATMQNNPNALGLSDAEKEKMRAEAVQTASAQNQALSGQLSQQALAGQGFQSGSFAQAQRDVGASSADAGTKAGTGINDLSNRMIESEKERIRAAVEQRRAQNEERARYWLNFGITSMGAMIGAAMNPAGVFGAAGGGAGAAGAGAAPAAPATAPSLATGQAPSFGSAPQVFTPS